MKCVRESATILVLMIASVLAALVISACVVLGAEHTPTSPGTPTTHEVSGVNLPIVCLDQEHVGKPVSGCAQTRQRFSSATEASLVRVCPGNPQNEQKCADYSTVKWKRFADVQDADDAAPREIVEVCSTTKQEGAAVSGGDCKASSSGSTWSGMKFVWKETVSHLPPLPPATFTVAPTSGDSPLDIVLSWNVPGMTGTYPCTATGDWEGQKAAASEEEIGSVMKSSSYTLTCTDIPAGGVVLTWVPPITNADGTPLTKPEGFLLSYGDSMLNGEPVLSRSVSLGYNVSTYTFNDLLPIRWFFAIQTLANGGVKSDLSNIVFHDVRPRESQTVQRYTGTVKVDVIVKPAPPGSLKATDPPAPKAEKPLERLEGRLERRLERRTLRRAVRREVLREFEE